jgi:FkbM family methyltransferase
VVDVMFRALAPKDIAIDCGANLGFSTLLMACLVGEHGWVLAVEPDSANMKALVRNIDLNKLLNVQVVNTPLWSRAKAVTFVEREDGGESGVVEPTSADQLVLPQGTVTKWATPLDQHELARTPKLVKIDVEGAEHEVLKGAEKLLTKWHPPYIVAEMNVDALYKLGSSQHALRGFMRERGYEAFVLQTDGQLPLHLPAATTIVPQRQNTNLLYATVDDVGALWPDLEVA